MSKNTIWRTCAASGSMPSATMAERCSSVGTVSFSSMLSAPLRSFSISASCIPVSGFGAAAFFAMMVDPPMPLARSRVG